MYASTAYHRRDYAWVLHLLRLCLHQLFLLFPPTLRHPRNGVLRDGVGYTIYPVLSEVSIALL